MEAVILCAAKKESFFPLTETKPTGLLPVGGVPIVRRLVEQLRSVGVGNVHLVVNHLEGEYEQEFGGEDGVELVRQKELKGTGHAVLRCDFIEDDFFVLNGDVIVSEQDLRRMRRSHMNSRPEATVLATSSDRPEKFGVLSIVDDEVRSIDESPEDAENALVNTGAYIFSPKVFDRIRESGSHHLTDSFEPIIEEDRMRYELAEGSWMEVDSLRNVLRADRFLREAVDSREVHDDAEVHENAEIRGDVRVEPGAVVREGVTIEGPSVIGQGAVLGPGTTLHASTVGQQTQIRDASVEGSLLFEDVVVDPQTHLERAVLAEGATVRSGTVVEESFIGAESFLEMNNSVKGAKFVPDARTDLGEISK